MNGHPVISHSDPTREPAITSLVAASRLGICDPDVLRLLPRACLGVTSSAECSSYERERTRLDQEGFFGETMRTAIAIGTAYQVGTHVLPPAVVRVGTRIEIAFLGPYTGPPPDSYFVAVVVEVTTGFTWVARLPTLDLHPLSRLVSEIQEAILDRMEWAPDVRAATHFSVASAVACPLPQCITTHHTRGGSPLTLQAHLPRGASSLWPNPRLPASFWAPAYTSSVQLSRPPSSSHSS